MSRKINPFDIFITLILLSTIVLSGCGTMHAIGGVIPVPQTELDPTPILPPVFGPEAARDVAIEYLQVNFGSSAPSVDLIWMGGETRSDGAVGASIFQYHSNHWSIRVSFPIVAPEATIYTIALQGSSSGFSWTGLVDAYGQVATTAVFDSEPTSVPRSTQIPTLTLIPPTVTLHPTPTPIPPTPTQIPVPCNAISFQADVSIQDGTIFAPDADFTKTWRLKNIGSCNWTTEYDLVFVEGSRMDGKKAIALPEKIRPDETLDISVELNSPDKAGDYRGYWMLRSGDGERFGYSNAANKAFWVDIVVMKSQGNFEYDFALNFCAATWRSDDMRLPCPGYTTSKEGFSQLLDEPKLENRNENELAIWVHPNEERYGWLEGTYPYLEIDEGDHFKAWVGCLESFNKCSLKFYLDYEDENGKVRRLDEWVEEYDGEVTIIDLDLSELAGDTVRLILGVEALTKNVDDAQGFWFVPHISQGN